MSACFKIVVGGGLYAEGGVGNVGHFSPRVPCDQQPICTGWCEHAEEQLTGAGAVFLLLSVEADLSVTRDRFEVVLLKLHSWLVFSQVCFTSSSLTFPFLLYWYYLLCSQALFCFCCQPTGIDSVTFLPFILCIHCKSFFYSHHFTDSWRSWWAQGQKSFSWFLAFQSFSIISFFLKLKCYYVSNAIFANACGSGLLYSYPFLTHLKLKVAWNNDSMADSSAKLTGFQFRLCRSSVS